MSRLVDVLGRVPLPVALLAAVLVFGLLQGLAAERPQQPDYGDSSEFLGAAYNLAKSGVYSQRLRDEPAVPGLGREPGYAAFLALLMRLDPRFAAFTPDCLGDDKDCRALYGLVQWSNAVFVALAGGLIFLAARALFGTPVAGAVAGGHLWLNFEATDGLFYIMSDFLALFLVALLTYAAVRACRSGALAAWAAVGLIGAALTLTKAVYLYFAVLVVAVALLYLIFGHDNRRRGLAAMALALALYAVPVGGWMARNLEVGDSFSVTVNRGGIALSTRVVFNDMTPAQYAAAFVFWTRGFGDSLARDLFDEATWGPFRIDRKDGFYLTGQLGYGQRVQAVMADRGLDRPAARAAVDRELRAAILGDLPTHAATTLPLFYRGIWIDEFVVISLPALIALAFLALWRRDWPLCLALGAGVFSLVFYALFSLNIPRYQITALPALALATGWLVAAAVAWRRAATGRANRSVGHST